jgi:acyl-coenzyme A thioesterase PaaI-like protein
MSASLDQARAVLAAQPFSRLLGARLNTFGLDGIELKVSVRPAHRQQHGFAHGGLLGYAADNALTIAAGAVVGPGVLTAGGTPSTYSHRSSATVWLPGRRWSARPAAHHRPL